MPSFAFENRLQEVTELLSLPEIYCKIHRLMDDPKSNVNDFAKIIKLDSNLSAKLLNAVNSAYYGFSGEITSIARAINMLGLHQLHIMVLSISAMTAVSSLDFPEDIIEFKKFWRINLLSGTLANLLAKQLKIPTSDQFFTLGLLHEIGHLFLYSQFPDLARQAIQLSRDKDLRIHQAEQQTIGCHYGIIGARLMENWQLPARFQYLIRMQPTPEQASEDTIEIAILHIAHAYAHRQFTESEQLIEPYVWEMSQVTTDILLTPDIIENFLDAALTASAEMEMAILK